MRYIDLTPTEAVGLGLLMGLYCMILGMFWGYCFARWIVP